MILKELSNIASKTDRIQFLIENKSEVLSAKKATPKHSDSVFFAAAKTFSHKQMPKIGAGEVIIVGNSCGFMDSHYDVSMRGSWNKTVQEAGKYAPILKDHDYKVDSLFAENLGTFVTELSINELGYNASGTTEVLAAKIKPSPEMYEKYQKRIITQHSVGLYYVKISLAINDESDEDGFREWSRNIDKVINREMAEKIGYFFPVYEQKLVEISAVVFGSNSYTPAFSDKSSTTLSTKAADSTFHNEPVNFYQILNEQLWKQQQRRNR